MGWFNFKGHTPAPQVSALVALMVFLGVTMMSMVASADELPSYERVRILQPGRSISDAELIDQDGDTFRLSNLKGRVALVFFGFTNCPDVCPLTMEKFRQLHDSDKVDSDQVAFVLISVDAERDTPEVLKSYLENFSADFIGLTGPSRDVKAIAKEFSASFFKGSSSGSDGNYDVMHSQQSFVLDREGLLRAEMYSPTIDAMAGVANALLAIDD